MDKHEAHRRAGDVAATLGNFLRTVTEGISETLTSHDAKLTEALRMAQNELDDKQAARDKQVLDGVAAKLKALRDDVQRFGTERDRTFDKALAAADSKITALFREEMAGARKEITEEIAVANRANYDSLMAEIKRLGRVR